MMMIQPLLAEDARPAAAMRQATSADKGQPLGSEARPMFDAMFAATPAAPNVRVETAAVGGIAGLWLRPSGARPGGISSSRLAAAVMSPWIDLALAGNSLETRAEADPIFTRGVLQGCADMYLQGQDSTNPQASPLYARFEGLPPIRVDVGDDEVLLSDASRYAERRGRRGWRSR